MKLITLNDLESQYVKKHIEQEVCSICEEKLTLENYGIVFKGNSCCKDMYCFTVFMMNNDADKMELFSSAGQKIGMG